jgi:hypothetical protein
MKNLLYFEITDQNINNYTGQINSIELKTDTLNIFDNDDYYSKITNKQYVPTVNDRLYFLPGTIVPRVKLRNLLLEYNIKTCIDPTKATHVFGNNNIVNKVSKNTYYYTAPSTVVKDYVEHCNNLNYIPNNECEDLLKNLENYISLDTEILCDNRTYYILKEFVETHLKVGLFYGYNSYNIITDEYLNINNIIDNCTEIYNQNSLINCLNGSEAITIDNVMFDQLSKLFDSEDTDNHILAMEILANCNYAESLLYILITFREYSYKISQTHTKNHVNFKSLMTYLDINNWNMCLSTINVIEKLIEHQQITSEHLLILLKRYNYELQSSGNNKFFKIDTITLSSDLKNVIDTPFIFDITSQDLISLNEPIIEESKIENIDNLTDDVLQNEYNTVISDVIPIITTIEEVFVEENNFQLLEIANVTEFEKTIDLSHLEGTYSLDEMKEVIKTIEETIKEVESSNISEEQIEIIKEEDKLITNTPTTNGEITWF